MRWCRVQQSQSLITIEISAPRLVYILRRAQRHAPCRVRRDIAEVVSAIQCRAQRGDVAIHRRFGTRPWFRLLTADVRWCLAQRLAPPVQLLARELRKLKPGQVSWPNPSAESGIDVLGSRFALQVPDMGNVVVTGCKNRHRPSAPAAAEMCEPDFGLHFGRVISLARWQRVELAKASFGPRARVSRPVARNPGPCAGRRKLPKTNVAAAGEPGPVRFISGLQLGPALGAVDLGG